MAVVVVAVGSACGGGAAPAPPPANDRRDIQREIGRWHDRAGAGATAQTAEAHQLQDQVTACERTARESATSTGQMMAKFGELADQMCTCTDSACAQKVSDAMSKWGATQAAAYQPDQLDDDEIRSRRRIGERLADCMTKAMSAPQSPQQSP